MTLVERRLKAIWTTQICLDCDADALHALDGSARIWCGHCDWKTTYDRRKPFYDSELASFALATMSGEASNLRLFQTGSIGFRSGDPTGKNTRSVLALNATNFYDYLYLSLDVTHPILAAGMDLHDRLRVVQRRTRSELTRHA